jgi:hypothetical protein
VATVDVSAYSHIRLAAHSEVNAALYISILQDGEEIAPLSNAEFGIGPLGLSCCNWPPISLDFAVPGQVLQIKAENIDPADGRLTLVVYGRD